MLLTLINILKNVNKIYIIYKGYFMITFRQWIHEGKSFEYNGHKYSSGFGRYTKDKESITKDEYMIASAAYKNSHSSSYNSVFNNTSNKVNDISNDVNPYSNIVKISPEEFKTETESAIKYVSAFDTSGIPSSKYKNTKEYKEARDLRDKMMTDKTEEVKLEVIISYDENCSDEPVKSNKSDKLNSLSRMYGYKDCISNDKHRYTQMIKKYTDMNEDYYDKLLQIKLNGHSDKNTLELFNYYKDEIEKTQNIVTSVLKDFGINSMKYSPSVHKSIMINDKPIKELDETTKKMWMMVSDITYRCLQMNPEQKEFSSGKVFIDMNLPEKLVTNLSNTFPNIKFIMKK